MSLGGEDVFPLKSIDKKPPNPVKNWEEKPKNQFDKKPPNPLGD